MSMGVDAKANTRGGGFERARPTRVIAAWSCPSQALGESSSSVGAETVEPQTARVGVEGGRC